MSPCRRCGRPLVTTIGGKCRFCGKQARFWQSKEATWTRKGAAKVLEKHVSETQAALDAERNRLRNWRAQQERQAAADRLRREQARWAEREEQARRIVAGGAMTWEQAEVRACLWMRENGFPDAAVTGRGSDGGVDVRAAQAIAQVKHHTKPVPRERIQQLSGIARAEGRTGLFFSLSGYSQPAVRWADENGVALFTYLPVAPVGTVATELVRRRLLQTTADAAAVAAHPTAPAQLPDGPGAPSGRLSPGARVRLTAIGHRGQLGRVERVRQWPRGSGKWFYDIRLDKGGPLVRLVADHKVEPI